MSYNPDFVIHIVSAFTTEQLSQTHNSLIDWLKNYSVGKTLDLPKKRTIKLLKPPMSFANTNIYNTSIIFVSCCPKEKNS